MKVSLVATSLGNRVAELQRLIASVELQTHREVEFVFVDQSPHGLNAFLEQLASSGIEVKYIRSTKRSLSSVRNEGLDACTGDLVGFPDDDCWYPASLLRDVVLAIQESNADAVCTRLMDPRTGAPYRPALSGRTQWVGVRDSLRLGLSAGLFVRSSKIGGLRFDERLGAGTSWGAGEETDFLLKLLNRGCRVLYRGDIVVFHPAEDIASRRPEKARVYARGFGATMAKAVKVYGNLTAASEVGRVLLRSLGGWAYWAVRRHPVRRFYRARAWGLLQGFLEGMLLPRRVWLAGERTVEPTR